MFGNIQPDETVDIYYNLSSNERGLGTRSPSVTLLTQLLKINSSCLALKLE